MPHEPFHLADGKHVFVDLSHSLGEGTPVFPGDPAVEISVLEVARQPTEGRERRLNNSRLAVGAHIGTHIDAPFHFFSDLPPVDQLALDQCCGPAVCLDLSRTGESGVIDAADLSPFNGQIGDTALLLMHTGWDDHWGESDYFDAHPAMTGAAAQQVVDWGVGLLGVDLPSVDRPPFPAHPVLLGHRVAIVENLKNLDQLIDRPFEFYAAPLPITGRDASPVRAFAVLDE